MLLRSDSWFFRGGRKLFEKKLFFPHTPNIQKLLSVFSFGLHSVFKHYFEKIQRVILSEVEVCVVKRSKPRSNATKGSRLDFQYHCYEIPLRALPWVGFDYENLTP